MLMLLTSVLLKQSASAGVRGNSFTVIKMHSFDNARVVEVHDVDDIFLGADVVRVLVLLEKDI